MEITMEREKLREFIFNQSNRNNFLYEIKNETSLYGKCIEKKGASCPIYITGECKFSVSEFEIEELYQYLNINCEHHVMDYILTGIQMDENITKNDTTLDLLDDLTSI
jgi:hypothetical protein